MRAVKKIVWGTILGSQEFSYAEVFRRAMLMLLLFNAYCSWHSEYAHHALMYL